MSRVGMNPIPVPNGVDVAIDGTHVTVSGSRGTLEHDLPDPISARIEDGFVVVERADEQRNTKALHGLSRSLVANMVTGVSEGYRKELEIVGVGYRAIPQGNSKIELQLGFSHPVHVEAPDGVTFEVPTRRASMYWESTSRRSAKWPPTSEPSASLSPTGARASATSASGSSGRLARPRNDLARRDQQ